MFRFGNGSRLRMRTLSSSLSSSRCRKRNPATTQSFKAREARAGRSSQSAFDWRLWAGVAVGAVAYDLFSSQKERWWRWVFGQFYTEVELRSHDRETFDAVLELVAAECATPSSSSSSTHAWTVTGSESERTASFGFGSGNGDGQLLDTGSSAGAAAHRFIPGYGRHTIRAVLPQLGKEGGGAMITRIVTVTRQLDDAWKQRPSSLSTSSLTRGSGGLEEVLTLTAFGRRGREACEAVVRTALERSRTARQRFLRVYSHDSGYWDFLCYRHKRLRDTVVLSASQERALQEMHRFRMARSNYEAIGVPWRRGYLLEGPPGSGKSSFIALAATELSAPLYVVSLSDPQITDDMLLRAVNRVPAGGVLVLEDVDTAFVSPSSSAAAGGTSFGSLRPTSLSLGGLLNALDGVASSEGRLVIVTANDASTLPVALKRPGRLDTHVRFTPLSTQGVKEMEQRFARLFRDQSPTLESEDRNANTVVSSRARTAAEVQHDLLQTTVYRDTA